MPSASQTVKIVGVHLLRDVDALEAVVDRHPPHACFGMTEAAEPVVVALEDISVDCAEPHAFAFGESRELVPVVDPVPDDVDRNRRTGSCQAMNERGIGDPLVDSSGSAGPGIDVEACPRVAVRP